MLLTVYNSKIDKYGNCYWAVQLEDIDCNVLNVGMIGTNNIHTQDCREMGWYVVYKELPIREFNRMVKGWEYLGSSWKDILSNLIK